MRLPTATPEYAGLLGGAFIVLSCAGFFCATDEIFYLFPIFAGGAIFLQAIDILTAAYWQYRRK